MLDRLFEGLAEGMRFLGPTRGKLFVELEKDVGGWLWRNGKIGNKSELGFDCFGGLVAEKVRGMMESIDDGAEPIALCGLPLWRMIVAKAAWSLAPFFFWSQEIWDNLSCSGWFHCQDTCSMVVVCVWALVTTTTSAWCAPSLWFLSCGGGQKFLSQFSGGPQPSESILCTCLG
jgi:hypothetical protein